MTIRRTILAAVTDTAAELGIPQDKSGRPNPALEVSKSDRPDLADYQCNAAMVLAKDLRKSPRAIASELQTGLTTHLNGIAKVDIAGPGFINFRLDDDYLLGQVDKNTTCATGTGESVSLPPRKVLIDFGGPNIAKELHIGHLRPHLIGDSLQRIAKACGDHVTSDIHMGDWGTPMGMIIAQLQHEKPELPYFSDVFSTFPKESPVSIEDLGGLYRRAKQNWDNNPAFQDKAREATEKLQSGSRPGYRALWQHFRDVSLSDVRKMYDKLGIHFDLWLGESDVNDVLPPMICDLTQRGIAEKSQGAMVIPSAKIGFPDAPPVILQKSDGGFTYAATDLATIKQRVEMMGVETILYVVDNRQKQHFETVFAAARLAGYAPANVQLEHIGHGTINGPDGRPFKTRSGNTAKLCEILEIAEKKAADELVQPGEFGATSDQLATMARQIGMASVKFQELKNARTTDYIFNVDEFTRFEGRTGPYLQYAYVRTNALIAKASEAGLALGKLSITNPSERELLLHLCQLPEAIESAHTQRAPNIVAEYAYGLAQKFGSFYTVSPILHEPNPDMRSSRLRLVKAVQVGLSRCFSLLGMETPERMLRKSTDMANGAAAKKPPNGVEPKL